MKSQVLNGATNGSAATAVIEPAAPDKTGKPAVGIAAGSDRAAAEAQLHRAVRPGYRGAADPGGDFR